MHGAVAKSYMGKGLIYEEMPKYFPIYEEAVSHIRLCNCSILNVLIYEENLIFFFYQCSNSTANGMALGVQAMRIFGSLEMMRWGVKTGM